MPIVSGISFGYIVPYNRVSRKTAGNSYAKPTRPGRASSLADFAEKAAYKYNRASRLVNQYKLYNRSIDTPTIGTIVNMAF